MNAQPEIAEPIEFDLPVVVRHVSGMPLFDMDEFNDYEGAEDYFWFERSGITVMSVAVDSPDHFAAAVKQQLDDLHRMSNGNVFAVGVYDDLVNKVDIAHRARPVIPEEELNTLIDKVGNFPPPVGVVAGGIRIWRWVNVSRWLDEHANAGDKSQWGFPPLTDEQRAEINLLIIRDAKSR